MSIPSITNYILIVLPNPMQKKKLLTDLHQPTVLQIYIEYTSLLEIDSLLLPAIRKDLRHNVQREGLDARFGIRFANGSMQWALYTLQYIVYNDDSIRESPFQYDCDKSTAPFVLLYAVFPLFWRRQSPSTSTAGIRRDANILLVLCIYITYIQLSQHSHYISVGLRLEFLSKHKNTRQSNINING